MRKELMIILKFILVLYIVICGLLFLLQEKLIFFPRKLDKDYKFSFEQRFEEVNVITPDGTSINSVLFKAENAKGVIFYLHGNAGSLDSWGEVAGTYTDLNYEVFMTDYRGYGKSEGSIKGQEQLFRDIQILYNELKKRYSEDKIIVLGYSLGTGLASKIASANIPKLLILQAPYYSMTDLMRHTYPIIPTFILKYKLKTNEFIRNCKMPVVVFHGTHDEVIYYGSSLKLEKEFKNKIILITLNGQGHNGMTDNPEYRAAIKRVLNRY